MVIVGRRSWKGFGSGSLSWSWSVLPPGGASSGVGALRVARGLAGWGCPPPYLFIYLNYYYHNFFFCGWTEWGVGGGVGSVPGWLVGPAAGPVPPGYGGETGGAPLFGGALGERGCLLESAGELAPWECSKHPSPLLPIPEILPLLAPSLCHTCRFLGRGSLLEGHTF